MTTAEKSVCLQLSKAGKAPHYPPALGNLVVFELVPGTGGRQAWLLVLQHLSPDQAGFSMPNSVLLLHFVSVTMLSPHPSGTILPFSFCWGISEQHSSLPWAPSLCLALFPAVVLRAAEPFPAGSQARLGVSGGDTSDRRCLMCCLKRAKRDKGHVWLHAWRKNPTRLHPRFLYLCFCVRREAALTKIHTRGFSLIWYITLEELFKLTMMGPLCTLEFSVVTSHPWKTADNGIIESRNH